MVITLTGSPPAAAAIPFKLVSAVGTNAMLVAAGNRVINGWSLGNIAAAPRWAKFYNKATAPVVGTDVPVMTLVIPGNTNGAGQVLPFPTPIGGFPLGLAIALTANPADSDNTGIGAGEVVVNLLYT